MKKINSIGYGGKIIGIGVMLLAVIPLAGKLVSHLTGRPLFLLLGKISFVCGAVVLIGFAILLAIELQQDKKLNHHYQSNRNERRALPNNRFECASCGNRQLMEQDKSCPICGIQFKRNEKGGGN